MNMTPSPSVSFSGILSIMRQKAGANDIGKGCLFTVDGRTALYIAIVLLSKNRPGKKWLVPSYFCPSVYRTFIDAKVPFELYPITEGLQPSSEYLHDKLLSDKGVGGVLFINYFGFKTDTKSYEIILKENNISVIYDCAHMLLPNSVACACHEDEAHVYSMRKWYPVPHGGALLCKNLSAGRVILSRYPYLKLYKQLLKYSLYNIEQYLGVDFRKYLLSFEFISKYLQQHDVAERYDLLMHDKVVAYLNSKMPPEESVREKQRSNYRFLADRFSDSERYVPLRLDHSDAECPFIFPLVVNGENRDEVLRRCLRKKIPLRVYWRFISDFVPKTDLFAASHNLSNKLLCLPVHYEMTTKQLEVISASIQRTVGN